MEPEPNAGASTGAEAERNARPWFRRYERRFLGADLLAGLTVGAMLVPQCIAYAELAGLEPSAGFRAALLPLVVYAFVGSSRHLGIGPEPGTAILAATGVAAIAGADPVRYVALMGTLALVVGVLGVLGALFRLGFLAELLSKPVLVGYITGVGLTLITSQLGKVTGIPIASSEVAGRLLEAMRGLHRFDLETFLVFAATLAAMMALRRFRPTWPGALLGVVGASVLVAALGLEERGVRLVGEVPAMQLGVALPPLGLADLVALLPVALGVTLVGYTDNVLTARAIGARLGYAVDPNRELGALGLVNLAAAFSGGFPISSSASRTAVPASLGSHTQLVSVIASGFLLTAVLLLSSLLAFVPQAALGAVIVSAALAIIDLEGLRALARISRGELAIALVTTLAVMAFDVLTGVLIALGASLAFAFARIAMPHDSVLVTNEDLDGWADADQHGERGTLPGLLVYRFDAPLFFANARRFRDRLTEMLERNPGHEEWVVLDFEGIGDVDATAVDLLAELVEEQHRHDRVVALARANQRALDRLRRAGLLEPEGALRVFPTIRAAVRAFEERGERPQGSRIDATFASKRSTHSA